MVVVVVGIIGVVEGMCLVQGEVTSLESKHVGMPIMEPKSGMIQQNEN